MIPLELLKYVRLSDKTCSAANSDADIASIAHAIIISWRQNFGQSTFQTTPNLIPNYTKTNPNIQDSMLKQSNTKTFHLLFGMLVDKTKFDHSGVIIIKIHKD